MLTAMIPARVSRTPQRLMFSALGRACNDMITRINAAAMTNTPGNRSSERPFFLARPTRRFHNMGIGVIRIRASVKTLAAEVTYRF